jgi:predicted dienelactone hydrolase
MGMRRFAIVLITYLVTPLIVSAQTVTSVAMSDISISDPLGERNLSVNVWYPTAAATAPVLIGDNAVFRGVSAIRDGEISDRRSPLVVLSHGLGGDRNSLGWLAVHLAGHGMIVAALNHPGTTRGDIGSRETRRPWERARDITRVVTFLTTNWRVANQVNSKRIAAIGHSLGGNSVMALAAATFDVTRFIRDCDQYPDDRDCHWYMDNAIDRDPSSVDKAQHSLRDARVTAVVALDVGFALALEPISLSKVDIPVLLIESARRIAGRPAGSYSRYVASSLPPAMTTYRVIPDARHFSFVAECKPGATDLLRADGRGDEIVCMDGNGRTRQTLHAEIAAMIETFLLGSGFEPTRD